MADLSTLSAARLARVPAFLSDVDGTLTTRGELTAQVVGALESLRDAGVPCVLVTGRPAGFGELLARMLPVHGVVAENGGLWLRRSPRTGRLEKGYAERADVRRRHRGWLVERVGGVLAEVPGARLSTDSAYTEIDLAIDYGEEVSLGQGAAERIERACRARGLRAVRSSVHVNAWVGRFDKRSTALRYLDRFLGISPRQARTRCLYLGDSLNDAPLFDAFSLSVGVGNVRDVWDALAHKPRFVVPEREGQGAVAVVRALLGARTKRLSTQREHRTE